ncbi:MAG: hypothetical protein JW785_08905 [Acidimicrobiia bacterium]|nr:hypothetical protein [Acidimicrobiia bacterium]
MSGDPADGLPPAGVRDLLAKGWLTHDGMWFDEAARAFGVEAANHLNRAAIRAMVPFEVRRLCEVLGVDPADLRDAAAVARFVAAGVRLVTPQSVSAHLRVTAGDRSLHWEWEPGECFAYQGMRRYGRLDGYRCGVIYRIECWLEALGVRARGTPAVEGCLMHATGRCAGELALALPG